MTVTQPLLSVEDLMIEFASPAGKVDAVRGISWHLDRGETLAILGESGSGKSVSASAVMDLIDMPPGRITSGRIMFDGQDLLTLGEADRRQINGRRIAMIFQDTLASFNPVYPVGRQISETCRIHGLGEKEAAAKTLELVRRVGIPDPESRIKQYPHQFSGGQRQRLMIAMALAMSPDVLLADEPTSALDVTVQAEVLALLKELQRSTGMGMLLITHDIGVAAEVADRIAVMHAGKIVEQGSVENILRRPQHRYTQKLLDAMPGRVIKRPVERAPAAPLLEVAGLAKHYHLESGLFSCRAPKVFKALKGVSLNLQKGETLGIVGESGSGKSTLARLLLRIEQPSAGTANFEGQSMFAASPAQQRALSRRIQAVFQDPSASLSPKMSVAQIISEPWEIHREILPREKWGARTAELLEQVGLRPEDARRFPFQFSGGQRQRIAIARALAMQPEIIVCDEAVSALDVSVQKQVMELLKSLQDQHGLSYLFITHDLPVVRDFADRILVMEKGHVVEQGDTEQIFEAPRSEYTRRLLASRPLLERENGHDSNSTAAR